MENKKITTLFSPRSPHRLEPPSYAPSRTYPIKPTSNNLVPGILNKKKQASMHTYNECIAIRRFFMLKSKTLVSTPLLQAPSLWSWGSLAPLRNWCFGATSCVERLFNYRS